MSLIFSEGDVVAGKYRLKKDLGGGGFGEVFKAKNINSGNIVALKVPDYSQQPEPTVDKYFGREKTALESIANHGGHPNIMSYEGNVEESGAMCLVLKFVQGKELGEYLTDAMNPQEARQFGIQLCDAFAFLHENIEVMYRDLKPDNVMVTNGEPILIDFTTAKEIETKVATSSNNTGSTDNDNQTKPMGGNKYKPPELLPTGLDAQQGPWSDVFCLGQILHLVLVNYAPDQSSNSPQAMVSTVPDYLDQIVKKATSEDPAERYGSALALKRALENREPEPPKEAKLLWFKDGTTYTINPGDTIGRTNDGPNTNIELSDDYVSAVHCRFDLDSQENWVLIDKSLNGTYVKKAGEPGDQWRCIRSDEGTERLRNKGHHDKADEREGEMINLNEGDTIAIGHPSRGGGSDAWYRFST